MILMYFWAAGQISLDPSSGAGCFGEKRPDLSFGTKRWRCIEVAPPEAKFWKMVMQNVLKIETSLNICISCWDSIGWLPPPPPPVIVVGDSSTTIIVLPSTTFSSSPGTSPLKKLPFADNTLADTIWKCNWKGFMGVAMNIWPTLFVEVAGCGRASWFASMVGHQFQ